MINVVGVPFDGHSSFLRGSSKAPELIRKALHCASSNLCTESRYDLGRSNGWQLLPDLELPEEDTFDVIEREVGAMVERGQRVISLGGDHSITWALVRAHAKRYPGLNILHLDAHPDLYDELDGNRTSHACPFARIMEEGLATRLVQVGIRTMNPHQAAQAERFSVEVHEMRDGIPAGLAFDGPVYLSLDMDCLDPAFAPGVSHHEPGGMTTREVLALLQGFQGQVVGADIVEYNPDRDVNGVTGMVAAKLLKEVLDRMLCG